MTSKLRQTKPALFRMLTFGERSRTLPTELQNFVYSFLDLADLAQLYFSSRGLKSSVAQFLSDVKRIWVDLDAIDSAIDRAGFIGMSLLMRFASSLREMYDQHTSDASSQFVTRAFSRKVHCEPSIPSKCSGCLK